MNRFKTAAKAVIALSLICTMLFTGACAGSVKQTVGSGKNSKDTTIVAGSDKQESSSSASSDKESNTESSAETGESKEVYTTDISEITWYVGDNCVVMQYTGDAMKIVSKALNSGRHPRVSIDLSGSDYDYVVEKCPLCGNYSLSYDQNPSFNGTDYYNNYHFGSSCLTPQEHCNRDLQITGEVTGEAITICVWEDYPMIMAEALPTVNILVESDYDEGYNDEESYYDDVYPEKQTLLQSAPERFLTTETIDNIASVGTFYDYNYVDGYALTDDYMLDADSSDDGTRKSVELRSFDDNGKLVQDIKFRIDYATGALVVDDAFSNNYGNKYYYLSSFVLNRGVNKYPQYFSKPYLTAAQFSTMRDNLH